MQSTLTGRDLCGHGPSPLSITSPLYPLFPSLQRYNLLSNTFTSPLIP